MSGEMPAVSNISKTPLLSYCIASVSLIFWQMTFISKKNSIFITDSRLFLKVFENFEYLRLYPFFGEIAVEY